MLLVETRISPRLISLLLLCLFPLALSEKGMSETRSVTGCLQKGVEPNGLTLVGEDGAMWELSGQVDVAHVGHKVTVSGHVLRRSKAKETSFAANEKQESGGKQYTDFQVTSLKMISDSCK
jgi:hypothetical protein